MSSDVAALRTSGLSFDTSEFEVEADLDDNACITQECARRLCEAIDKHGFVIAKHFLSDRECAAGLEVVRTALGDPARERSSFASQTDIRHGRRDFCPLPSTEPVLRFCSLLARRGERVLTEYCSTGWAVLEISTLTSYAGCSHQYLHRDPSGVLCVFVALEDVSPEQGGTVLAPGTHPFIGFHRGYGGKAELFMRLFQLQCNMRIMRYNLRKITRLWRSEQPRISTREFVERVFSKKRDEHQPNIYYFLTRSPNSVFNLSKFGLRTLIRLVQYGKEAARTFRLIQASPKRGAVIIYRSDILHAGPDNRSEHPRYFLNINLARDVIHPEAWHNGYSPHSSLRAKPMTLGELINYR
ncbi:MAG TPA: hypothetical protein VIG07_17600 [Methylomirabilota bacterium]|jgi:hypothetical protein